MTPAEEAAFEVKAEKMLAGHRGLQNGRDFRWNVFRFRDEQTGEFKDRWEETFKNSPVSEKSLDSKYCNKCDKLTAWCECV